MWRNRSFFVGLAIQHGRLSMVKLGQRKEKIFFDDFAMVDFPSGSIIDGKIMQPEIIAQLIKELARLIAAETCSGAVALPFSQVINKRIKLPAYLDDNERNTEIKTNLQEYLPGVQEPIDFDFVEIEKQEKETEILLVAARAAQVAAYVDTARQGGLKISIVDVDIYALIRAVYYFKPHAQEVLVINMGIHSAHLMAVKNKSIVFSHVITLDAQNDLAEKISRDAQRIFLREKMFIGKNIFLTGSAQSIHEIKTYLQDELNLIIEIPFSFSDLEFSSQVSLEKITSCAPELLVPIGLALRGF